MNRIVFITVTVLVTVKIIDVSMATNVAACDVCATQGNDLPVIRYLLHKSIPVAKKSILVCIKTTACGFALGITHHFTRMWAT